MNWSQLFNGLPLFMFAPDDGAGGGGDGDGGGDGAGGDDNWADSLPEDVRSWDEVTNSDSPDKFWKQMSDMRNHLGQSIRIPSEDAGEDDWKKFNEKLIAKVPGLMPKPNLDDEQAMSTLLRSLGHPEKEDGYVVPEIKPEGDVELDLKPIDVFKPIAHKHGLTQRQFEGIVKDMSAANIQQAQEAKKVHDQNVKARMDEWGQAHDKNMDIIQNIADQTNAPENLKAAIRNGSVNKETAVWMLDVAHKLSGTEGINITVDRTRANTITPSEATSRINEIMNNRQHPYWDAGHPQHKQAVENMLKLQKAANPQASTDVNDLRSGARAVEAPVA